MECQSAGMDLMSVKFKATHVESKFTGTRLCLTLPMTGLLFSLTRDGNGCRVFSAIGRSTLPHENSFTFFSCSVMEGPCSYFYFLLSDSKLSHSLMAACTFFIYFYFLVDIHSRTCRYKYCTLQLWNKQPRVHPQVCLYCLSTVCKVLPLIFCCLCLLPL